MANQQKQPGMTSRARLHGSLFAIAGGILLFASICYGQNPAPPQPNNPAVPPSGENVAASKVEGEMIVQVRVVGNKSLSLDKITPHIRLRANRAFSMQQLQEDTRSLDNTRMFVSVKPYTQRVPGGIIVIFDVLERPMLMEVKYIGNVEFNKKALEKETKIKIGDPVDPFAIEESRRTLEDFYRRKGYAKARITLLEGTKAEDRRAVYYINEGQKSKIEFVKFVGNTIATSGRLRTQIETKHPILYLFGGEFDRKKLDEDVDKLIAYYRGLGFFKARIGREVREFDPKEDGDPETLFSRVARGANQFETANWVIVTFTIDEGPRYKIRNVAVKGNKKYANEELMTDLKLANGEYFNQAKMTADMMSMQDKYGGEGYVFSKVTPEPRFLENEATLDLIYNIEEGARYHVGKIDVVIKGEYPHTKITTILNRLSLHPGDIVDMRELRASERRIKSSQLFNNNPGEGDVPKIAYDAPDSEPEEASPEKRKKTPRNFRGQSPDAPEERELNLVLHGTATNPKAWDSLPEEPPQAQPMQRVPQMQQSPQMQQAAPPAAGGLRWLPPRQEENARNYPAAQRPNAAPLPRTSSVMKTNSDFAANSAPLARIPETPVFRGQYTPASGGVSSTPRSQLPGLNGQVPVRNPAPDTYYSAAAANAAGTNGVQNNDPANPNINSAYSYPATNSDQAVPPQANADPTITSPSNTPPVRYDAAGALPPPDRPAGSIFRKDSPMMGGPADGDLNTLPLDLHAQGTETTTGRFMFGVGVNSDAGLFGSVIVDEQNFSLFKFPRRWEEITNATALRGEGQRLRLEAAPGTQVQRYSASWQVPYLLDTQYSLGVNGYYYSRAFTNWFEQRIGGGVSFGKQFTPDLSGNIAYRGAQVNISNPNVFDVPQINAVVGTNALHGFSVSGAYDTRDNPFLATEGHLISAQFEEVIGTWVYPRASIDLRKHFKIYERPDGSGRHTLTLSGRAEYTGPNTPIYENIFYGGFSSIRGFAFRGVSPMVLSTNPVVQDVAVGGQFGMLGSAEYMFPITADDMLRGVVFVDSGTVEPSISNWNNNYRVAPGFGLRISVPAMGPAPIALDFAFPVASNPGDVKEVFSFFIGFGR